MKLKMPRKQKRLRATAQRAVRYDDSEFGDEPGMKLSRAFFVVLVLHLVAVGGIFLFNSLKNSTGHGVRSETAPPPRTAEGVSRAAAKPPPAGNRTTRIHQMRKGESLLKVAAFYGVSVADLEQANGIKPGTTVPFGTEIRIPTKASLGPVPLDVRKLVETPRGPLPGTPTDRAPRPVSARAGDQTPAKPTAAKAPGEIGARSAAGSAGAAAPARPAAPTPSVLAATATTTTATASVTAPASPASDPSAATPEASGPSASLPSGEVYLVAKGDNPAGIAKRFGVSYSELLKVNAIDDPRRLQIGQRLLIPKRTR